MKTILRIITILVVASIVAGAFFLAVNNNSTPSSTNQGGQFQIQPNRFEGGDRDGGSIIRGLGGVLGTLAQIAGITVVVLLIQKVFSLRTNRRLISTQR